MSVERLNALMGKFDRLEDIAGGGLRIAVARQIQVVSGNARDNCPTNHGELRHSIHAYSENTEDGVKGTCYTTKKYAKYVELGTGPKGEANHAGISPAINPVYTQSPWWIHESQINKEAAEKYHWFSIKTDKGVFYQCTGQPAHPFLYPAIRNNEDIIVKSLAEDLQKEIKKI